MNNSDVVSTIKDFFKLDNDFNVIFIDGHGDCADEIKVKYAGEVYYPGYIFTLNVNLCFSSSKWVIDVNGYNELKGIDSATELRFALLNLVKFARTPSAEQIIAEKNTSADDEFYI